MHSRSRYFLTSFMLCLTLGLFAQDLPNIYAKGGKGTEVNWEEIREKYYNEHPDGLAFFESPCLRDISVFGASSTLGDQSNNSYGVDKLQDNSPFTAWVEGEEGYGIGTYFYVQGHVNMIFNGYQKSPRTWSLNSRVKTLKVYKNEEALCLLHLKDEMGSQRFELPGYQYQDGRDLFKFEIVDVYPGSKWADVAISEIRGNGCCFQANTVIASSKTQAPISSLEEGSALTTIDLGTNKTSETIAVSKTQQLHLSLLTVRCGEYEVQCTPEHPLYIENHGFASLPNYALQQGYDSYKDLAGNVALMVWDEERQRTEFKVIDTIMLSHGDFRTYTILELKEGDSYIANGFVTTTY